MHGTWNVLIAILLVAGSSLACSRLRPRAAFTWQLTLQLENPPGDREAAIQRTIKVIDARLDAIGVSRYDVARDKAESDRIIVKLPGVSDHERLKNLIVSRGKLELFHVLSLPSPSPCQTYDTKEQAVAFVNSLVKPETNRVLPYFERASSVDGQPRSVKWVIVKLPPIIDGSELRNAQAIRSAAGDDYEIDFSLHKEGAEKFGAWTGANINEYLGVALNDEVKSIAFIRGQIFDSGQITGRFTKAAAEDLTLILRSGALPAPVKIVAEENIK